MRSSRKDVRDALARNHVSSRKRYARKNRAFRRQGEWFFVPEPTFVVDEKLVLRNEPLRRGSGKPHMVEELYRTGGETVHVCGRHPNGVTAGRISLHPAAQSERRRVGVGR